MTDNEIVKIAEHCAHWKCFEDCEKCYAFKIYQYDCGFHMAVLYLDFINRQKAEIERYKGVIKLLEKDVEAAKAEIEKLKAKLKQKNPYEEYGNCVAIGDSLVFTHTLNDYDKLIKDIGTEAIWEFVERLKNKIWHHSACNHEMLITPDDIYDLAREMTEEK